MTRPNQQRRTRLALGAWLSAIAAVSGCHSRAVEVTPPPAAGTYPVDGSYLFNVDYREGTRASLRYSGHFVVADSQVTLYSSACEQTEAPKGSEGNAEAWFQCKGSYGRPVQLRINRSDPINRSRWYADLPVRATRVPCRRYAGGVCVQAGVSTLIDFAQRSGEIEVRRGLPPPRDPPPGPASDRLTRVRCDTTNTEACPPPG